MLSSIPETSVYRQGVEALTQRKLKIVENANGKISEAEKQLDEGHIEQSLDIATDEMNLVSKMIEWKAYAHYMSPHRKKAEGFSCSWEPLVEQPEPGQWQYFGKVATAS